MRKQLILIIKIIILKHFNFIKKYIFKDKAFNIKTVSED